MALEWLTSASGQLAVGATEATLFAKSNPSEPVADLQFQSTNFSTEHLTLGLDRWPGFGFNFCVCRPKSRGEIKLADGTGAPSRASSPTTSAIPTATTCAAPWPRSTSAARSSPPSPTAR